MFRRHWSGLPQDVSFPSDLKGLGYFVNEIDEIRSIDNPDNYFKFFINKNPRINARQRFEFNYALEVIVHERLGKAGLRKAALPLGTPNSQPHIPIFVTPNLKANSRIVVVFGEPSQDLGILTGRVANGPGGINKGSLVSLVDTIGNQVSSNEDASPPGVILANMGQLYWWPEGKRAITVMASAAMPLPSLVHAGRRHLPAVNYIAGNEDPARHVDYIFNHVLATLADKAAKVDIVAIGESCEIVERFLNDEINWAVWGTRLNSMVLLGPVYQVDCLNNPGFKEFLAKRTRAYLVSSDPIDSPLAPPEGNPDAGIDALGCPCFSSAEPQNTETILIQAKEAIMSYLQNLALDPDFENPIITVAKRPTEEFTEQDWETLSEELKPQLSIVNRPAGM